MSYTKQNLRRFKIHYSPQYIQIIPILENFRTQILINKRTNAAQFEDISKQFEFSGSYETKYASLILGLLQIQGDYFLVFVEQVYLQAPLPPDQTPVYQLASISYLEYNKFVSNRQRDVFQVLQREIFNFSFYYSFSRDLTLCYQKWRTQLRPKPRDMFFWNAGMLKALNVDEANIEWYVPVFQGHYGRFQVTVGNRMVKYYLISRRSKYRSGTRFYNRGIDQNSKCANFIQTQQVIVLGSQIISMVALSGSHPIFWEQRSQGDKIRLTRNKQLTTLPFIEHLNQIKADNGRTLLINLLDKSKEGQNLLTTALEQIIDENAVSINSFCRYVYYDINQSFRKGSLGQVFQILSKIDPLLKQFGFFRWEYLKNDINRLQRGVIRVNCLDCLSRTQRFLQAFFFYQVQEQLHHAEVTSEPTSGAMIAELLAGSEDEINGLMLGFKCLWQEKAAFESLIYTGNMTSVSRSNSFLDEIADSQMSLQRLYNQKFMDEIKQKSLDLILYHKHYRMESMLRNKQNIEFHICIVSWNVNATSPEKMKELSKIIDRCEGADLVIFGVQEMIQLNTNNIMSNNEEQSQISSKWVKKLEQFFSKGKDKKIFVQSVEMVGLMQIAFISDSWKHAIKSVQKDAVKTGMGGQFGNKGAVAIRLRIYETTVCFTCAHLSAGQSKARERLDDLVQIHKKCFQQSKEGIQNEVEIQESDYKFFFGDLNFRIEGDNKKVRDLLESVGNDKQLKRQVVGKLLENDQLTNIRKEQNIPYQLECYEEPEVTFLPTYKLDKNSGAYTEERSRVPSWCDRILFWGSEEPDLSCECLGYSDVNMVGSDHRPVVGRFRIVVNQAIRASSFIKYDLIS